MDCTGNKVICQLMMPTLCQFMNRIMIETALREDPKPLTRQAQNLFILSYGHFVRFFQERTSLTLSDFVIGAHFTYGWMPSRILAPYVAAVIKVWVGDIEQR
jgi:hypothetical protein